MYPNCTIVSNIDPFFSRMSPVNLFPIISQCDCYLPKLITHVQSPWVAIGNHLITLASGWYPGLWHVNHDSWTNLKYWQWAKSIKLMLSRWVWSMFQLYWYSCFFVQFITKINITEKSVYSLVIYLKHLTRCWHLIFKWLFSAWIGLFM